MATDIASQKRQYGATERKAEKQHLNPGSAPVWARRPQTSPLGHRYSCLRWEVALVSGNCSSSDLLSRNYGASRCTGQDKTVSDLPSARLGRVDAPLPLSSSKTLCARCVHTTRTQTQACILPHHTHTYKHMHAYLQTAHTHTHMRAHLHTCAFLQMAHTHTRAHVHSTHAHACTHFRNPQTKKMKTENAYSWKVSLFVRFLKFIWLHWILVAACELFSFGIQTLSCSIWD